MPTIKKKFFKKIRTALTLFIVCSFSLTLGAIFLHVAFSAFTQPTKPPTDANQELGSLSTMVTNLESSLNSIASKTALIGDIADTPESTTLFGNLRAMSEKIATIELQSNVQDCFISQKVYNGNLGGRVGADQKCQAEAPGYHFGTLTQWAGHAKASYANPNLSATWIHGGFNNCGDWINSTTLFGTFVAWDAVNGMWTKSDAAGGLNACSSIRPLVCCNFVDALATYPVMPSVFSISQFLDFSKNSFTLKFKAVNDEDGYYIYRGTSATFPPDISNRIGTLGPSASPIIFIDSTIPTPGQYFWKISAYNQYGESDYGSIDFDTRARKVFVSSLQYTGKLGGVAGADSKCQTLASAAGLEGTWKAWVSASSYSPKYDWDPSKFNYGIYNLAPVGGYKIAENWPDLTDGTLGYFIQWAEDRNIGRDNSAVWTDTNYQGGGPVYVACSNWTNETTSWSDVGATGYLDTYWTQGSAGGNKMCNAKLPLYCFQYEQ